MGPSFVLHNEVRPVAGQGPMPGKVCLARGKNDRHPFGEHRAPEGLKLCHTGEVAKKHDLTRAQTSRQEFGSRR
ncbi:hypothetical protein ACOCJ7_03085 [Knoellia sp. CPCC 206453]|uniref:hypothetical protein n=1 Tax=Knoellia pratensis TaxID=3404796 RepID=UPI00362399FF